MILATSYTKRLDIFKKFDPAGDRRLLHYNNSQPICFRFVQEMGGFDTCKDWCQETTFKEIITQRDVKRFRKVLPFYFGTLRTYFDEESSEFILENMSAVQKMWVPRTFYTKLKILPDVEFFTPCHKEVFQMINDNNEELFFVVEYNTLEDIRRFRNNIRQSLYYKKQQEKEDIIDINLYKGQNVPWTVFKRYCGISVRPQIYKGKEEVPYEDVVAFVKSRYRHPDNKPLTKIPERLLLSSTLIGMYKVQNGQYVKTKMMLHHKRWQVPLFQMAEHTYRYSEDDFKEFLKNNIYQETQKVLDDKHYIRKTEVVYIVVGKPTEKVGTISPQPGSAIDRMLRRDFKPYYYNGSREAYFKITDVNKWLKHHYGYFVKNPNKKGYFVTKPAGLKINEMPVLYTIQLCTEIISKEIGEPEKEVYTKLKTLCITAQIPCLFISETPKSIRINIDVAKKAFGLTQE